MAVSEAPIREDSDTVGRDPELPDLPVPARGTMIGRYLVVGELGEGGMGVVLDAYDPDLDRRVAVKLLHQESADEADRLRREAQAMARLSHPNVLAVYDVGTYNGRVFFAMERLDGGNLSRWIQRRQPAWRDVVRLMLEAGAGLASAHGAGLVHRDFKPDNVLIGEDGRARVTDFGLARATGPQVPEDYDPYEPPTLSNRVSTLLDQSLTAAGWLAGTPPYMAPEQWQGKPLDGRTDQFAFCATLYEALYGQRAFVGDSWHDIRDAVLAGRISEPASTRGVPARVRRVIYRGLSVDPEDRYGSLAELLSALQRTLFGVRLRWVALAAAAVTLAAVSAPMFLGPLDMCADAASELSGAWSPARKRAVGKQFRATGLPYAEDTLAKVAAGMDAYASSWIDARVQVCRMGEAAGVTEPVYLSRLECLGRQRQHFEATSDLLLSADAQVVESAPFLLLTLEPASRCEVGIRSTSLGVGDDSPRAIQTQLARAAGLEQAGKYPEALHVAHEALAAAVLQGELGVRAEAQLILGRIHKAMGEFGPADESLDAAIILSRELGDLHLELSALDARAQLQIARGRLDDAEATLSEADERFGVRRDLDALRDDLALTRGRLARARHRPDEAFAYFEQALTFRRRLHGPDSLAVGEVMEDACLATLTDFDELAALQPCAKALEIYSRALGPGHPRFATLLHYQGVAFNRSGQYEQGSQMLHHALRVRIEALGADHPDTAKTRVNIGVGLSYQERFSEAIPQYEMALETFQKNDLKSLEGVVANNLGATYRQVGLHTQAAESYELAISLVSAELGEDHPRVARIRSNFGGLLVDTGQVDEADAMLRRALRVQASALGRDHYKTIVTRDRLGSVYLARGDYEEAHEVFEQTVAAWEKLLGPQAFETRVALTGLAEAELGRGNPAEALEIAAFVLDASQEVEDRATHSDLVWDTAIYARALWEVGEAARAWEAAQLARERSTATPLSPAGVERLDAILAPILPVAAVKDSPAKARRPADDAVHP